MTKFSKYIGLDVHKETTAVAVADGAGGEPRYWGEIKNRPEAVRRLLARLGGPDERLRFCYEAGPCGYGLYRQLVKAGYVCVVVAPALIPRKPGDRVKTDRRDGLNLARLDRAGELTAVVGSRRRTGGGAGLEPGARGHEDPRQATAPAAERVSAATRPHLRRQAALDTGLLALAGAGTLRLALSTDRDGRIRRGGASGPSAYGDARAAIVRGSGGLGVWAKRPER